MVSGWTSGRSLPYKHLLSAPPPRGVLLVYINDNLFCCCCCCLFLQIIVEYPKPKNTLCIVRLWFRHIGFGLAFTSLLLKTWRFV